MQMHDQLKYFYLDSGTLVSQLIFVNKASHVK